MPELDAEKTPFNPFDLTKVWPHGDFPPIDIGVFELNRNPDNYFAEIENVAFSPSNIVPGISWSPDKMLQARIFSYADAHRHRLGTHYETIPVNRPLKDIHHYHRDGQMNIYGGIRTGNPDAFYEPNSFGGPVEDKSAKEPPLKISGDADRYNHRIGNDDYSAAARAFQPVRRGTEAASLLQHRGGDGRHSARDRGAPACAFRPGASGLRQWRARRACRGGRPRPPGDFGDAANAAAGRRIAGFWESLRKAGTCSRPQPASSVRMRG